MLSETKRNFTILLQEKWLTKLLVAAKKTELLHDIWKTENTTKS